MPEAIRFFNRALEKEPQGKLAPLVAYKLGVCAYFEGKFDVAATAFGQLVANYPTSEYAAEGLFWQAQSLERQQDTAARATYLQYVTKYPAGEFVLDAALGAGRCAIGKKDYALARTDLQRTLDLCRDVNPNNSTLKTRAENVAPETQFYFAQSYYLENNYAEALKEFAVVVRLDAYFCEPWASRALLQMVHCSALMGDKTAAQNALDALLRLNTAESIPVKEEAKGVAKNYGLKYQTP